MRKYLFNSKTILLLFAIYALSCLPCKGQITLVRDGKSVANIIISPSDTNFHAANILNQFVKEISGVNSLPILPLSFYHAQDKKFKKEITKKNNIFIGFSPEELGLSSDKKLVLIVMGSLGSRTVNDKIFSFMVCKIKIIYNC